jgi:predicted glycogen debranching enzyme
MVDLPETDSPFPRHAISGELRRARKEWLHTNGAGAYASSTIAGMHTRRYHGLLVAALDPPRGRHVILSHVDASVTRLDPNGRVRDVWDLAKHQFPGTKPESTALHLQRFDQDPLPRWTYRVADGDLEITLGLVRGQNAVILRFEYRGPAPVVLSIRPLLAMRPFHQLQKENGGMEQRTTMRATEIRVQPRRDLPPVCFRNEGAFVGSPDWWRRFEYLVEQQRGLGFHEDLWTPGTFTGQLESERPSYLMTAIENLPEGDPEALLGEARLAILRADPGPGTPLLQRRLSIAAEAFRADLAPRPSIIAGYPWFEVWGRDTLIALPGLYLVQNDFDGAIRILRQVIRVMRDGLVPNRVPDEGGAAEFNSADATLWLFEAARLLTDRIGDAHRFVTDELLLALRDAFEAVLSDAPNGIHVTAEGLLSTRDEAHPSSALTWMDACINGVAVTPRAGCPVELTALWARGCETLGRLARAAGDHALTERALIASAQARAAFRERFWCAETGYPYDVISETADGKDAFRDASVRPNAVIALAIDPECFTEQQAAEVLDRARRELVTPAGLRSLAPGEPGYVARYGGGVAQRDEAYHQGTVWPFLLAFYVRAARRGPDGESLAPGLRRLVASAAANELAVGQVAEFADGDPPHAPNGCFAQAWSVAELLRALAWDLKDPAKDGGEA